MLKYFSERATGIIGLIGLGIGMALILLSLYLSFSPLIIAAVIFITLGEGLFDPLYNGRLSNTVDESNQGKLRGVSQTMQAAYRVLVPLLAAALFLFTRLRLQIVSE